ncbi:hypothetical protein JCGZ_14557 [Jatropha curcas]|uniref:Uncharacterized protein n=1 Tax=Jatropha curcas TaxID=180498 RepID=A0A067JXV7_JATCU|nr:hypothetical protein JCGZ_14557 [Jatropha curcas]
MKPESKKNRCADTEKKETGPSFDLTKLSQALNVAEEGPAERMNSSYDLTEISKALSVVEKEKINSQRLRAKPIPIKLSTALAERKRTSETLRLMVLSASCKLPRRRLIPTMPPPMSIIPVSASEERSSNVVKQSTVSSVLKPRFLPPMPPMSSPKFSIAPLDDLSSVDSYARECSQDDDSLNTQYLSVSV